MESNESAQINLDEVLSIAALKYLVQFSTNMSLSELDVLSRENLMALYLDSLKQKIEIKNAPLGEA